MKIYLQALLISLKITLPIILLITLLAVVFTLITSKTPVIHGIRSFVVLSGSMEPNLPLGSIVFTKAVKYYQAGDVIAFKQGEVTITHRIFDVQRQGNKFVYQTKGDANEGLDIRTVSGDQVLGKQVYRVLNVGKLIVFLKTIPGFITILIIPTLIFIGFEFWNIKKEIEKEVEKKILSKMRQPDLDTIPRLSI